MNGGKRGIARNAFFQFLGRGGSAVLAYLLVIFIARTFGPEGFGYYSLAFAVGGILGMLFNGGIEFLVPRDVSRNEGLAQEYLVKGFSSKLLVFAVTALPVFPLLFIAYGPKVFFFVLLGSLVMALRSFIRFFESFFLAFQRMKTIAFSSILTTGALLAGTFLAVSVFGGGLGMVFEAQLAAAAIVFLLVFALTLRKTGFSLKHFSFGSSAGFSLRFMGFGAFLILGAMYANAPVVILSLLSSPSQLGFFTAALSLAVFLETIPLSIGTAFFPLISRVSGTGKSIGSQAVQSLKWSALTGVPLSLLLLFFSKEIAFFLFGEGFLQAGAILAVLSVVVASRFLSIPIALILVAAGHEKLRAVLNAVSLLGVGVLCFFLIPLYGALGAAFSLAMAAVLDLALSFGALKLRGGLI